MIRQSTIDKYVGKKFNRVTVLSYIGQDQKNSQHYLFQCKCECGNVFITRVHALVCGATKSCGCFAKERALQANKGNKYTRLAFGENAFNTVFALYKRHAKTRNIKWHLDKDAFRALTKGNCYYCGCEPNQVKTPHNGYGEYVYNGIDRVDNTVGYTEHNCVSACRPCNSKKNAITPDMIKKAYDFIFQGK